MASSERAVVTDYMLILCTDHLASSPAFPDMQRMFLRYVSTVSSGQAALSRLATERRQISGVRCANVLAIVAHESLAVALLGSLQVNAVIMLKIRPESLAVALLGSLQVNAVNLLKFALRPAVLRYVIVDPPSEDETEIRAGEGAGSKGSEGHSPHDAAEILSRRKDPHRA